MSRTFTIADAHSSHDPKQSITVEAGGGDPWFAEIWVNDQMFLVSKFDDASRVEVENYELCED